MPLCNNLKFRNLSPNVNENERQKGSCCVIQSDALFWTTPISFLCFVVIVEKLLFCVFRWEITADDGSDIENIHSSYRVNEMFMWIEPMKMSFKMLLNKSAVLKMWMYV